MTHLWTRRDSILVGALLLLVLMVQLWLLRPPSLAGGDQLDYFSVAADLEEAGRSHRHLRLGLLFPVAALIRLFGYSEIAYYAVPVLGALVFAGSTYWLARLMFGSAVALTAGSLVVFNPYVLWGSSHLLPDLPGAALVTLGLAAVVFVGERHGDASKQAPFDALLLTLSGFLMAWGYLVREIAVVAFLLAVIAWVVYQIPWRSLSWIVLGAAFPLLLEWSWGLLRFGDPLIRIRGAGNPRATDLDIVQDPVTIISQFPALLLDHDGGIGWVLIVVIAFAGGTWMSVQGHRRAWLLTGWGLGLWALLTATGFSPLLLDDRVLLRLQKARYWFPLLPGITIMAAAVITSLVAYACRATSLRPYSAFLGAMAILLPAGLLIPYGLASMVQSGAFVVNDSSHYIEFRSWLATEGQDVDQIYVDHDHGRALGYVLPMYTRTKFGESLWRGDLRPINPMGRFKDAEELDDPLARLDISIEFLMTRGEALPTYILHPPDEWKILFLSSNERLAVYEPSN